MIIMIIMIIIITKMILMNIMKITNMRAVIIIRATIMPIQIRLAISILLITIMQKLETAYPRT